MRIAIAAALLATLLAVPARADDRVGYVDLQKVFAGSAVVARSQQQLNAEQDAAQQRVQQAQDAAKQARARNVKASDLKALDDRALSAGQEASDAIAKREADLLADLRKQAGVICGKVAAERHLAGCVVGTVLAGLPGRDLTDETLKRWNASDLQATAAENEALKKRVAELEAARPKLGTPAPSK